MEADVARREPLGALLWVVDAAVVAAAEQDAVAQVGGAVATLGVEVVGVTPGAGDVAAFGAADPVSDQQCLALGAGEEALVAAQVEGDRLAVEDGRDDPCSAGQSPGLVGGDLFDPAEQAAVVVTGTGAGDG